MKKAKTTSTAVKARRASIPPNPPMLSKAARHCKAIFKRMARKPPVDQPAIMRQFKRRDGVTCIQLTNGQIRRAA